MSSVVEITLSLLAWLITLFRLRKVVQGKLWQTDRIAFHIWIATLAFALTMTFLITPFGHAIDRLTAPNLARLLAYLFVTATLHLVATSFLVTFPTQENRWILPLLRPYLIFTQIAMLIVYVFFVSRTPEWSEAAIPATAAEMIFKLVFFSYASILCALMATACYSYLDQEAVTVTKYRIVMIILTALGGAAFFTAKVVLSLGYIWPVPGIEQIHTLSMFLEALTAVLWAGSFINSDVYARVLAFFKAFKIWSAYQDMLYLAEDLSRIFPPVGMRLEKASYLKFLLRSEFYLYRSIIHILDGAVMLVDFLENYGEFEKAQAKWNWSPADFEEAWHLALTFSVIPPTPDLNRMIGTYSLVGRQLREQPR